MVPALVQHIEVHAGAGRTAKVPDGLIGDELTVGQGERLQAGTVGGKLGNGNVGDENVFFKVHPL
jgi:hypothetical protein